MLFMSSTKHARLFQQFFGTLSALVPLEGVDRQMVATESSMEGLHLHVRFYSVEAMPCLVHSICHEN